MKKPLALVTRPTQDCDEVAKELSSRGFSVHVAPLIQVEVISPKFREPLPVSWDEVDWVILTSRNGARVWSTVEIPATSSTSKNNRLAVATIGERTAEKVRELCGYSPDFVGSGERSELFIPQFLELVREGDKIVVAGACKRRGLIETALTEHGVQVFSWNLYDIVPSAPVLGSVSIINNAPSVLWTFFSGSAVSAYVEWRKLYSLPKVMPNWYFAAFGEPTAAAMRKHELPPCVVHCGGSYLAFCDLLVARFL